MSSFSSRWLDYAPARVETSEPLEPQGDKTAKSLEALVVAVAPPIVAPPLLASSSETVPRLPWQLERLLAAAGSGVLGVDLPGVPDAERYTLAWGVTYLISDRDEALARLWTVHKIWQAKDIS